MGLTRPAAPAAVAFTALAALASPGAGQDRVLEARLSADVASGDGAATVRLEYALVLESDQAVYLEVLVPEDVDIGEVTTGAGEAIQLAPPASIGRGAFVDVGAARSDTAGPSAAATLTLTYRVAGAVRSEGGAVRVTIPVVGVQLPPAQAPDVFVAEVAIPEGWSISEGFPSGLRPTPSGAHGVTLPVVPSLVSLRGRTDGAWRPGADLIVELVTTAVLLLLGLAGWRRLPRPAP